MSEVKVIQTNSIVTNDGSTLQAYTYYNGDALPNILQATLASFAGSNNGVRFLEGDLLMVVKNYPMDIDVQVNSRGDLVIIGDDANKYSVDGDGYLIYTP